MGASARLAACVLALTFGAGCAPPRPTWVRPDAAVAEPPKVEETAPAPVAEPAAETKDEAPEPEPEPEPEGRVHVVARGENLYRIALQYGLDQKELASHNGIRDPRSLTVGQKLSIPGQQVVASRSRARARGIQRRDPDASGVERTPPLHWPVKGVLYSRFGPRGAGRHDGIDISAPEGSPIVAAAPGEVLYAGNQRGYGKIVILRHEGDLITVYAHNRQNLVREGDQVAAGQPIAKVGRTGRATGPHCHFEVRKGTKPQDPLEYLPR